MRMPSAPRMVAVIPSAPLGGSRNANQVVRQHVAKVRQEKIRQEKRAPLMVQMQTSDPNIVIYWIAD